MAELDLNTSVGRWVAEEPTASRVFEALHIDYGLGGEKSLSQACAELHVDPQEMLWELAKATADGVMESAFDCSEASLAALCDHIEQTHHAYLKRELPRLKKLVANVAKVHAALHPELALVQQAFNELEAELVPHMFKEERVLFPAIRCLEQSEAVVSFLFGTMVNPIRMMQHEHDDAGRALDLIRSATADYRVPENACKSYRAMLQGLFELEQDLRQHIHKENDILFPMALELERSRANA